MDVNPRPRTLNPSFMHEIRHFKPTLYLVMLLGLSGYALAAATPGLWIAGTLAILLHAWLSRRGRSGISDRLHTRDSAAGVHGGAVARGD